MNSMVRRVIVPSWGVVVENDPWLGRAARVVTEKSRVTAALCMARQAWEARPKPMPPITLLTDDELLSSNDPEAFGVFYDRHVKALLGYFARRTYDAEEAADLTAETFASALVARRRFKPGGPPATAWLFKIAARRLADYQRKGHVAQRMRRSLEMERRPVGEADAEMIRMLGDDAAQLRALGAAAR